MRKIYCKSSIDIRQINARKELNKDGIELQLLSDFVEKPQDIKSYISLLGENVNDIKAVHVPLKSGEEIVEIQMLSEQKEQSIFNRICELSQKIAEINKEDILIVIHSSWSIRDYKSCSESYLKIKKYLKEVLLKYPNIKIGIENVIPYAPKSSWYRNGVYPDYVELVKGLQKELDTKRIGTVLDICHALVTIRIDKAIKTIGEFGKEYSIEDYYKANEGVCMLVHLCDVEKLGFNKYQHGIGFEESRREFLRQLIELHKKYINECDITIEVLEKDYMNCKNYKATRKMIEEIVSEIL